MTLTDKRRSGEITEIECFDLAGFKARVGERFVCPNRLPDCGCRGREMLRMGSFLCRLSLPISYYNQDSAETERSSARFRRIFVSRS